MKKYFLFAILISIFLACKDKPVVLPDNSNLESSAKIRSFIHLITPNPPPDNEYDWVLFIIRI